jgi:hypothetical protein
MRYTQMFWVMVAGLVSMLALSPSEAQAAANVSASLFGEASNLATGLHYLLIIIAGCIVLVIGVDAISSFQNGNISRGIIGAFSTIFSAVLLFTIIPGLTDGPMVAAATLR